MGYTEVMNKLSSIILWLALTLTATQAQTLGSALEAVEQDVQTVISQQTGDSWGAQTAADDLNRLLAQAQRLSEALDLEDARKVEELQRGLTSAAQRVETSSVLLSEPAQQKVKELLATVGQIDERLTELRLRFGGQANLVPGRLSEVSLSADPPLDGVYSNLADLLIDVRDARRLAGTLGNVRYPAYGFNQGGLYNIDPLQLDRVVQAGWALERQLSGSVGDVSDSLPAWNRFEREYNRLGYMGTGSNVRQLERVMDRLANFYDSQEL